MIAGGLLFTRNGVTSEFLLNLLFYIIITPVISLTLTRIMYMSENELVVADALARVDSVLDAEPVPENDHPRHPKDASVSLKDVHFSYDGKTEVIKGVSLEIQPGQTVAFVGPSGGGKSTLANLICRFFDVQSGSVRVGGADVRDIPKEELMDTISFVFQNSRLLKGSILDNVRLGRAQATEAEVLAALKAAQCMEIVEKFPAGIHTVIGTKGVYLSGGTLSPIWNRKMKSSCAASNMGRSRGSSNQKCWKSGWSLIPRMPAAFRRSSWLSHAS